MLIDAVGIEVPGHPVADFFGLTMDEVFRRSFHDPEPFHIDPACDATGRRKPSPPATVRHWPRTPANR